jgi:hypothetical protein
MGFAAFALWYAYESLTGHQRRETAVRIADGARAVVYAFLAVLAISALSSARRGGDTDRTQQTWTANMLDWSGGRLLLAVVGLVVCGVGAYLVWRAISGGRQDSQFAPNTHCPEASSSLAGRRRNNRRPRSRSVSRAIGRRRRR